MKTNDLWIDCGGADCMACGFGAACGEDVDCAAGLCVQGVCVSNSSCKALVDIDDELPDGMYMLDPDDDGPGAPFTGFCDMTYDGGGWTLIMKSIDSNYRYDDPLWTDGMTENPDDFDFATPATRAKYPAFNTIGFGELRTSSVDMTAAYAHTLAAPVANATALFTGPAELISSNMVLPYFDAMHAAPDKHSAGCNPADKFVNHGINLKLINGVDFLVDGDLCDWNGGARFGMRVNGNHEGTGDLAGQGWGTYTTVNEPYVAKMTQLLWVR